MSTVFPLHFIVFRIHEGKSFGRCQPLGPSYSGGKNRYPANNQHCFFSSEISPKFPSLESSRFVFRWRPYSGRSPGEHRGPSVSSFTSGCWLSHLRWQYHLRRRNPHRGTLHVQLPGLFLERESRQPPQGYRRCDTPSRECHTPRAVRVQQPRSTGERRRSVETEEPNRVERQSTANLVIRPRRRVARRLSRHRLRMGQSQVGRNFPRGPVRR